MTVAGAGPSADGGAGRVVADGVAVHRLALVVGDGEERRLTRVLSPGERRRAARFRFARDRARFVAAHAGLRAILAPYAGVQPANLRFGSGPHGKPRLRTRPDLRFNLAHACDVAVVAVAWGREVGVDVEPETRAPDLGAVARSFFSSAEHAALAALAPALRAAALPRVWCRKEAYAKARGRGLGLPFASFDVAVEPSPRPGASLLLATRPRPEDAEAWELRDVDIGAGFVAALSWERRPAPSDPGPRAPRRRDAPAAAGPP